MVGKHEQYFHVVRFRPDIVNYIKQLVVGISDTHQSIETWGESEVFG